MGALKKGFDPRLPPAELKNGRARREVKAALRVLQHRDPEFPIAQHCLIVDIGCSIKFRHFSLDRFPTITAGRGAGLGWWIVDLGRQCVVEDLLRLQGIPENRYDYSAAGVTPHRLGFMRGNAMSCNVLERLLPNVLKAIGVRPSFPQPDRWAGAH